MAGNTQKVLINPGETKSIYKTMQFSQAVRVGNTLWVSGQVGINENGVMGEDIEAQARMAFQNLKRVLTEAGGSMDDVVELVTYHRSMADIRGFAKVKSEFITHDYPAWTAVGVTELLLPNLMVEMKATAIIGSGKADDKTR